MDNRITINWSNFSQTITDKDGRNSRVINWNVPHALYKSTTPLTIGSFANPHAVIPADNFEIVDEEIIFDTKYYYRLSELRPGGEFFTDQVSIEIKHHILKFEAPFLACIEYDDSRTDAAGNIIPYTQLNLSRVDDDGNRKEVLKPEWFWTGKGRISEWLEFIVNDETIAIRERGTFSQHIKSIVTNKDRRNYPAGFLNGTTPVTSRAFYLGKDNIVEAPYWWAEWHDEVQINNPDSWHAFWASRFNSWDDTQDWYDEDWTTNQKTLTYDQRPYNNMNGPYNVSPYEHPITDLVLRARIGTSLSNGVYTGQMFIIEQGGWVQGSHNAIPRPGNSVGIGLGATLTFRNIRERMNSNSVLSFNFNGSNYTIPLTQLAGVNANDITLLETTIFNMIESAVGSLGPDAPEPNIDVSFGPRFDKL